MAKSQTTKRDEEHELTRRALIKWSLAAGAALGVAKSGVLSILEKSAGKGTAFAAEAAATTRNLHMIWGNGGAAHLTLLWPHPKVALANNPNFSWHKPGQATNVAGTRKPLVRGPDTPWESLAAARQMTAFVCGANQTHTQAVTSTATINGTNLYGAMASLQSAAPSVVPVIALGEVNYATAPGSPQATGTNNANGLVGLFNSAASQANGLLVQSRDANVYKAQFDAFSQLNRAANRSTTKQSYQTASSAAGFLGRNLASKLAVTAADETRYGINGNTRGAIAEIGRTFIVAIKAFKMGLTNSILMPGLRDDPHGFFAGNDATVVPPQLKLVFDAFMNDLITNTDDATGRSLADDFVFSANGDTTKDALNRNGWPDGTNRNHNVLWVWGGGNLFSGWFGELGADGNAQGFDATGNLAPYNGQDTARFAAASVLYAIAKRDERLISQFANGIQIADRFGPAKVQ